MTGTITVREDVHKLVYFGIVSEIHVVVVIQIKVIFRRVQLV